MAWTKILGQSLAIRMLQTHLRHRQVAPAYLFVGPEGVGKHLAAFEMAKALICQDEMNGPCDQCESCQRVNRHVHPDIHSLAPQGAAEWIRIDEVRQVIERIVLRPFMARFQVAILDGADRLTEEAANSLLKILEEPPAQTRFLLITSQPAGCLPTIVSRCQVIRFQRLSSEAIEAELLGKKVCDAQTALAVSRLAQGSIARAMALATQWHGYQALISWLADPRPAAWREWAVPPDRQELSRWLVCAIGWLRDVAVASAADESLISHREAIEPLRRQAQGWDRERCIETALRLIELWESLGQMVSPRLVGTLMREAWITLTETGSADV